MGKMQIWWRFKYELAFDFMRVMINTVWNEYILYRWRHTYDKPYPDLLWNKTKISCSQCTISIEFHFIHILFQLQPKLTTGGETLLRLYCIYILYIVYYIYIIYIYISIFFITSIPTPPSQSSSTGYDTMNLKLCKLKLLAGRPMFNHSDKSECSHAK